MRKAITERIADTAFAPPALNDAKMIRCSECRKRFERLSEKWAYHFKKNGKDYWQCTWTCHRKAERRLYPPKALRGEHCLDNMDKYHSAYIDRNRDKAPENCAL